MNREIRNKFASGTDHTDLTTGTACWETAPLVYVKLNEDFGPFDVDLTADAQRALCPAWFGPGSPHASNTLTALWHHYGRSGYSNPPYGRFIQQILPWAKEEAAKGFISTFLLPLRVTRAFKNHVLSGASDLFFCDKRLAFFEHGVPRCSVDKRGKLHADTALFDSTIVRYSPGHRDLPRVGTWEVPPHVTAADLERAASRRKEAA